MDKKIEKGTPDVSRRQFVQGAAATAGLSTLSFVNHAKAAPAGGSDAIKVCLIGCGGRGSGAVDQILSAPKDLKKEKNIDCETRLVAVADAFPDSNKFRNRLKSLKGKHGDKFQVTEDNIFGGLDGYKAAIDESKADLVVIATPPGLGYSPLLLPIFHPSPRSGTKASPCWPNSANGQPAQLQKARSTSFSM